jgi:hypothetical protein
LRRSRSILSVTGVVSALLLSLASCGPPDEASRGLQLPDGIDAAVEAIDEATVEAYLREISSDAMEGRGPGTDADLRAQQMLEDSMKALGLEPGGIDGWRQPFDIVGITAEVPQKWSFRSDDRELDLEWDEEFIAASGIQAAKAAIEDAELVFVGYGIKAPEHDWDDFKGADLRGKVLVMLNNDPNWDPELFEGSTRLYYGRWTYKYESAAAQGAVGAIIIHTTPSAGYPWQVVQTSWTGEQFELPWEGEPRVKVIAWVTEKAARRLVELSGFDLQELRQSARTKDFRPVPLEISTSFSLTNNLSERRRRPTCWGSSRARILSSPTRSSSTVRTTTTSAWARQTATRTSSTTALSTTEPA